jgi:hypothetical protein
MTTAPTRARPTMLARMYSALFRVLGPAQLGDPDEPPPPPLPVAAPCPRCHRPIAEHRFIETPQRKRLRCPE